MFLNTIKCPKQQLLGLSRVSLDDCHVVPCVDDIQIHISQLNSLAVLIPILWRSSLVAMTNDSNSDGVDRRNLLKGIGFGAMGVAGASMMTGGAAAQETNSCGSGVSVANIGITPQGDDLADDRVNPDTALNPANSTEGDTSLSTTHPVYDLVFFVDLGATDSTVPVGYHLTVLESGESPKAVPEVFEEGSARCFSGNVRTEATSIVEMRDTFSVEMLDGPNNTQSSYQAVVTITNYATGGMAMASQPFDIADGT